MITLLNNLEANLGARRFVVNNPILDRYGRGELRAEQMAEAMIQYTYFPQFIVELLAGAANWFDPESGVGEELARNMSEELGSKTGGLPHARILLYLLRRDLNVAKTAESRMAPSTETFRSALKTGMTTSKWYALGQAYALESSAVPELLQVVWPAVIEYADMIGRPEVAPRDGLMMYAKPGMRPISTRDEALAMKMNYWIAMHVYDFEVGHQVRLCEQVERLSLDEMAQHEFERGFLHVMDVMDVWWSALAQGK